MTNVYWAATPFLDSADPCILDLNKLFSMKTTVFFSQIAFCLIFLLFQVFAQL